MGARVVAAAALALCGLAAPAWSTSMRPIADGALADQADLIIDATVLDRLPARVSSTPSTEYQVLIERTLKGHVARATVTVRVAGGRSPDGRIFVLPAAPRFEAGERVLLFLVEQRDGTWGVLHLGLGRFRHRVDDTGVELAVRGGGVEPGMELPGGSVERDWARWSNWLADRAAGLERAPDYLVPALTPREVRLSARPALAELDGLGVRWFLFGIGGQVRWEYGTENRTPGYKAAFRRALKAWTRDKKSNVDLTLAGPTESTSGFQAPDGSNALIFSDPNGIMPGRYQCNKGGVLATAGWWIDGQRGAYEGNVYYNVFEAEIVLNNGTDCFAKGNRRGLEELFGHELGHTLGLDHPCGDDDTGGCDSKRLQRALMRGFLHNDGRGSKLTGDDRKGLRILY